MACDPSPPPPPFAARRWMCAIFSAAAAPAVQQLLRRRQRQRPPRARTGQCRGSGRDGTDRRRRGQQRWRWLVRHALRCVKQLAHRLLWWWRAPELLCGGGGRLSSRRESRRDLAATRLDPANAGHMDGPQGMSLRVRWRWARPCWRRRCPHGRRRRRLVGDERRRSVAAAALGAGGGGCSSGRVRGGGVGGGCSSTVAAAAVRGTGSGGFEMSAGAAQHTPVAPAQRGSAGIGG